MQPILCLVDDHRLRTIQHLGADFFTPVGGQTVHDNRIGLGTMHQAAVDLIRRQDFESSRMLPLTPHTDPDVGIDDIRFFRRNVGIMSYLDHAPVFAASASPYRRHAAPADIPPDNRV
jgi:hypothetical protein